MNKLTRFTVLFFAFMLSISIGTDHYGKAIQLKDQPVKEVLSSAHLTDGELNSFCLFRSAEHVANPVNSFPTPLSKSLSAGLSGYGFSVEVRIQHIARQYLLHSKGFFRSLSVRDIIFPFHYFL